MLGSAERGTAAYIALGANLGDRAATIRSALAKLARTPNLQITAVSSLLENPAVGGPADSPTFLNAAASLSATLSPQSLLARLLEIEQELGRTRSEKNAPRTIDLDLLLYDDWIIDTDTLKIPHPRMHERPFVLQPLAEIAPEITHPTLKRTIRQLLEDLRSAAR